MNFSFRSAGVGVLVVWLGLAVSACERKAPTAAEIAAMPTAQVAELAAANDINAVTEMSVRYVQGNGVPKDEKKALELLGRGVAKNHPVATYLMGVAHAAGIGVPQDDAKAVVWFERAANLGNSDGQYWLAFMTAHGRGGITASWENAYPLMLKAAELGHSDARFMLGYMYHSGNGVQQDFETAAMWYRRASEPQINQKAQMNIKLMIEEGKIKPQPADTHASAPTATMPTGSGTETSPSGKP